MIHGAGNGYLEIDIDVGSSSIAAGVVSLIFFTSLGIHFGHILGTGISEESGQGTGH